MTDKERLAELLRKRYFAIGNSLDKNLMAQAEYLLEHGVILPPEQEEPTPTEMVDALRGKGWTVDLDDNEDIGFCSPDNRHQYHSLKQAYLKAFPSRRMIQVDVYYCPICKCVYNLSGHLCKDGVKLTKGTATFEVPEEEE